MNNDNRWVIKIGGSLGKGSIDRVRLALGSLLSIIEKLSGKYKVVIVPGGGVYADFIRDKDSSSVSAYVSHAQAALAVCQYGYQLAGYMKSGVFIHDESEVEEVWDNGLTPIFIPYPKVLNDPDIPVGWDSDSDTFTTAIAGYLNIGNVALLKSVDGIFADNKLTEDVDADSPPQTDVVNPSFFNMIKRGQMVYIINGKKPGRLRELITSGKTTGTRIFK